MAPQTLSADRVRVSLAHHAPDRVPVDFGSTNVSGVHISCVAALRRYYGLGHEPVKVLDPGAMLGEVAGDLKDAMGIDTEGIRGLNTRYGFPMTDWKPWRMYDGLEILVPGGFTVTVDDNGDTLIYPQGDLTAPPSGRMPRDGYFFDAITRQDPVDDDNLNPAENLEEYGPLSDADLDHFETVARAARATGRAVIANFGGTALGDIGVVPGVGLKHPKGIRDVAEWYVSTTSRRDYVHKVFEGQVNIALANYERLAARLRDLVDVVNICGTDFGTQTSAFCSVKTLSELWLPYYRRINDWIHQHTPWKTFKHSCGAVSKFVPSFVECGFDILNPVQCSATGMDPETLKQTYGRDIVFWGGGVDTQQTLPFGTPAEVREQVLRRCELFAEGGGFVFNAIHNIQAATPVDNIVAMIDAVREFNGR
ncbi:MAG: methyltransferase [Acidobacteria bacterium]|nr:methyltransferase [Acidobacteriota bacterium]